MKERNYTITIRGIDLETKKKLKMLSFNTDKSINSIVLDFIKEGLDKGENNNAR